MFCFLFPVLLGLLGSMRGGLILAIENVHIPKEVGGFFFFITRSPWS